MNIPNTVDNRILASLAAPDETKGIRVVIRRVNNQSPYMIRGKFRHYRASFDSKLQAHVLDIPESVWMHGFPVGPYRDNLSIAHDLQGNRGSIMAPLVFLIIPWGKGAPAEAAESPEPPAAALPHSDVLKGLRLLADRLGAPDVLLAAIDLVGSDRTPADIAKALEDTAASITDEPEEEPKEPAANVPVSTSQSDPDSSSKADKVSKAAIRMRRLRERQRSEREAAKPKAKHAAKKAAKKAPRRQRATV